MSASLFCSGLPIVDELPVVSSDTSVILRAKNREEAWCKIRELQNKMTTNDVITVYEIGLRPDKPVPVAMHFSKICIRPGSVKNYICISRGSSKTYIMHNLVWGWNHTITGLKDISIEAGRSVK